MAKQEKLSAGITRCTRKQAMPGLPCLHLAGCAISPCQNAACMAERLRTGCNALRFIHCFRAKPMIDGQNQKVSPAHLGPVMRRQEQRQRITAARNGDGDGPLSPRRHAINQLMRMLA